MSDPDISNGARTVRRRARTTARPHDFEDRAEIAQILRSDRHGMGRALGTRRAREATTKEKMA